MTDVPDGARQLSAADVARMRTPLWEQAKTALAQGRPRTPRC
jgi:hypothetical protein